jgi:hypothetical protein
MAAQLPVPGTIVTEQAIAKETYLSADDIENVMIEAGYWAMHLIKVADMSGAKGKRTPIPIIYGSGGGVGSIYTAAFASAGPATAAVFEVTPGTAFGVGQISRQAILQTEGQEHAFIEAITLELETKRRRLLQYLAFCFYGDGSGVLAQVSESQTVSSTVLTLADPATAVRFNIGDVVNVSATVGGAVLTAGTNASLTNQGITYSGCAYVVGVNVIGSAAGTLGLSATPGGAATALSTLWTGIAAGAFIYLVGDAAVPANPYGFGNSVIPGIMAWQPLVAPISTDNFYGQNRFNNTYLYGATIDATSFSATSLNLGSIREALTYGVAQLHAISAKPTIILGNPALFYALSLSLQSQGMYPGSSGEGPSGEGSFGFSSLNMPTPHGTIKVMSDPQCAPFLNPASFDPANGYSGAYTAFILEEDDWKLLGAAEDGSVPFVEKRGGRDGDGLQTIPGLDVMWFDLKFYGLPITFAPGHGLTMLCPQS